MQQQSEPSSGTPVLEVAGGRATIRLNRPRHLNRIEPEDIAALTAILGDIEGDDSVRVVVLTGTGRAFCAGYHLGDLAARRADADVTRPAATASADNSFETLVDRLENLRAPTICRLNGSVYGGGTDLALACDFRIGAEGIEMFMPAARLGLHYYRSGIVRYVTRLGVGAAKKLFLTAQTIDAAEMLRIGYLDEVVPAAALDARVDELADILADLAPIAVQGMKQSINEAARGTLDQAAVAERSGRAQKSDDIAEGLVAYRERRRPRFTGR